MFLISRHDAYRWREYTSHWRGWGGGEAFHLLEGVLETSKCSYLVKITEPFNIDMGRKLVTQWHVTVSLVACYSFPGGMLPFPWWHVTVSLVACYSFPSGMLQFPWWHVTVSLVACYVAFWTEDVTLEMQSHIFLFVNLRTTVSLW